MTTSGLVSLLIWAAAGASVALAAAHILRRSEASTLETLALASFAGLHVPVLLAQWAWFVPLGALEHLTLTAALCLVGSAALLWHYRPMAPLLPRTVDGRSALSFLAISIPALGVAVYSAMMAALKPVGEWDGLTYHGPTLVKLVTTRSMFGWDLGSSYGFYPNLTAFLGAPVAAATHSTRWLDAVQVLPWAVMLLVAWAWGGRGRPKVLAGAIVLVAATSPAIFTELRSLATDVVYAGGVVVGVYGLALWAERKRSMYAWWAAMGLAVAVASKPAGAILVAGLTVVSVLVLAALAVLRRRWRPAAAVALMFSAAAALGSPLYLRNWWEFGNPIYPVSIEWPVHLHGVFSAQMFLNGSNPRFGTWPKVLEFGRGLWEGVRRPPTYYNWDLREGGFDRTTLWLALIAACAALALLVTRRWSRPSTSTSVLLGGAIVVLYLQPNSWNPRYSFAPYVLMGVAVARLADRAVITRWGSWTIALAMMLVGGRQLRHVEANFDSGFSAVDRERRVWPELGDSFGSGGSYGSSLERLVSQPCGTKVIVQANDDQKGRLSTFSLGLWGDQMCNDVHFVHASGGNFFDELASKMESSTFVVVDVDSVPRVQKLAGQHRLTATVVGGPLALTGVAQVLILLEVVDG